jgi:acetyl-CoA/propionyl-CoA carboxylase biotin carboxyl carrier protein
VFEKVLIANRGEIAVRIARTCRELGVSSVAVFSDADDGARHVTACDEAFRLPGVSPADTYLNVEALIETAIRSRAEAVHPGYGFLSENAAFAEAVTEAGLAWVGPPPAVTRAVGDKIEARRIAESAGVPVVPGLTEPVEDLEAVRAFGAAHGYPLAIKAAGGGGGRGLKVAHSETELEDAFTSARREALAYFGSSAVYVERYLESPKHMEVQILALSPDEALWLGVRDCSLQRRHQKLIEETPPPRFAERVPEMGQAAVTLSKACGYVNAGTVEMLVDTRGDFYFLEVNARLQVEHTVTEEVLGIDLVACQLKIASGEDLGFGQADLTSRGWAMECRVNAEDPARGFVPAPGVIAKYTEPDGLGVRVDSGYGAGDEVPAAYDSLVAKVVTWGRDREQARRRMLRALQEMEIEGVATTIPAHLALLNEPSFVEGSHSTTTVEAGGLRSLQAGDSSAGEGAAEEAGGFLLVEGSPVRLWNRAMARSAAHAVRGGMSGGEVVAPMHGTILEVLVEAGQEVSAGDPVVVLEAMKMETSVTAATSGTVKEVLVAAGETAGAGQVVAIIE